jgi:alkylated DNA nucleotide flippase Atl1
MSETSIRAKSIAHILWELKEAGKLATFTSIAARAGFSPGVNGRTVGTTLKVVRREWPHLQWWRAIEDSGRLSEDQRSHLAKAGFRSESIEGYDVLVNNTSDQLMTWNEPSSA